MREDRRSTKQSTIDLLHKSKIVEGFLGETKPSTAAYTDVREERRRVSTTKSPTRLTYAISLISNQNGLLRRLTPTHNDIGCFFYNF
ncbi:MULTISPECIES: hypothetical protein [unclassified Candidatus Tisiphia]|uniref:hypothetical protein n=1 Tax=unclassified Candidatus Tisiphia TaxID=2996318 RepID=UPI00312CA4CB